MKVFHNSFVLMIVAVAAIVACNVPDNGMSMQYIDYAPMSSCSSPGAINTCSATNACRLVQQYCDGRNGNRWTACTIVHDACDAGADAVLACTSSSEAHPCTRTDGELGEECCNVAAHAFDASVCRPIGTCYAHVSDAGSTTPDAAPAADAGCSDAPIVGPVSPTTIAGSMPVRYSASYRGCTAVTACQLVQDGAIDLGLMSLDGAMATRSATLSIGTHQLQVQCRDAAGNWGYGPVTTITVGGASLGRYEFCGDALGWAPSYFGYDGCCAVEGSFRTSDHVEPGMLVTAEEGHYVYYIGNDGRRYWFSSSHYLASWFLDPSRDVPFGQDAYACSQVVLVPHEVLDPIPLGGSVPMRPGVLTVGITTDPKRYVIDHGNALRWIDDVTVDLHLAQPWLDGRDIYTPDAYFVDFCVGTRVSDTLWHGPYDGQRLYDEATIQGEIDRNCGH